LKTPRPPGFRLLDFWKCLSLNLRGLNFDLGEKSGVSGRKEIKRVMSEDGKRRMLVMAPYRNLFRFEEETHVTEDGYTFWSPTHVSGLYDSAEAAELAARMELPWLRDKN